MLGTVIVEAGGPHETLVETLDQAMVGHDAGRHRLAIACRRGEKDGLAERLPDRFRALPTTVIETWRNLLPVETSRVAFLPSGAAFVPPRWDSIPGEGILLKPLVVQSPFDIAVPGGNRIPTTGWAAPTATLHELLRAPPDQLTLFAVAESLAHRGVAVGFLSAAAFRPPVGVVASGSGAPTLHSRSRVLAVVPHYRCEAWLGECLRSLMRQTRPPEAIVVVDDASPLPPLAEVAPFPGVTLLAAAENVGPYRLLQSVIERTGFDAYMLQDADDWSSDDRLALLLDEAERTGAELIGCQELRFDVTQRVVSAYFYPPDAGRTMRTRHLQAILHPSSLVSRSLVSRVGGFSAGLRFGGDLDFQLRAHHLARAVNIGRFGYFRRRREGSLWTAADTGPYSPARRAQEAEIETRSADNGERVARGQLPDLEPYRRADPVPLAHLAGPALA